MTENKTKTISKTKKDSKKLRLVKRIAAYTFFIAVALLLSAELILKFLLPLDSVKNKITETISTQLSADVSIKEIRAGITGVYLRDVAFSIKDTELLKLDYILVRFSIIHLLKGEAKVNSIYGSGLDIEVIRNEDGSFNFDSLLASDEASKPEEGPQSTPSAVLLALLIDKMQLKNSCVTFIDKQQNINAKLDNLFIDISDFSFDKKFRFSLNTDITADYQGLYKVESVPFGFTLHPDFKKLNLDEVLVEIRSFALRLGDSDITVKGNIKNANIPLADLYIRVERLSNQALKPFVADLPEFKIPLIEVKTLVRADYAKSKVFLNSLKVDMLSSEINVKGALDYGKKDLAYNADIDANIILDKLGSIAPMIKEYKPFGTFTAQAALSNTDVSGEAKLAKAGAFLPQAGDLKDVEIQIKAQNIKNIRIPVIRGNLNGSTFSSRFSYSNKDSHADINFNFKSDNIYAKDFSKPQQPQAQAHSVTPAATPQAQTPAEEAAPAPKTQTPESTQISPLTTAMVASAEVTGTPAPVVPDPDAPVEGLTNEDGKVLEPMLTPMLKVLDYFPPLNVKADVSIGKIEIPFLVGNSIFIKADVRGVTSALDKTQGSVSLISDQGEIKDLYTLTNANALTKVLFGALGIVSRVINTLNVLDTLGSIGSTITNTVTGGKGDNVDTGSQEHRKMAGKLDYSTFRMNIELKDGISNITDGYFASDMLSFIVNGHMNFKDQSIKMIVKAAPGNVSTQGIMPITLNIGGTIDNPSGSMSVIGSAAALVTQTVLNNPASNLIKKGVGGIGSLFGIGAKEEGDSSSGSSSLEKAMDAGDGEISRERLERMQGAWLEPLPEQHHTNTVQETAPQEQSADK